MVITAIAAVAVLASHCAHARDLGVIGPVYAIAEPSLLEVIQTKLRQMQANGDLSRLQRESQARIQREVEQPAPVPGITKTTRARSFHFDPSIEVPYPITDAEGRVIVAPGTRVNPLDTVSLSRPLLFIDARDTTQLDQAQRLLGERRTARGCASMNCCSSALTRLRRRIVATLVVLASLAGLATPVAAGPTCHGQFMNPITDICWSCMFPLTLGSATLVSDGQPDISNPSSPVCFCSNPPRIGVAIGFWEPVRLVDVTRTPFCMVGLGGLTIDPGIEVPRGAQVGHDSQTRNSFYQVHWYANPILSWLEVLLDFPCLEKGPLDLAYLTEIDPLWADDELAAILNPEAVLFANVVAKAACAADCVAASAGMPLASLFWCAGCQGSIYPMTGHVSAHVGDVQASVLLAERMTAKMHRQLTTFSGAGSQGLCGYYPLPIMDKTHYKLQMVYPVPATAKEGGQCCQPYGRTTMIWGSGKAYPVSGEDFAYQIFRKRNCCAGAY